MEQQEGEEVNAVMARKIRGIHRIVDADTRKIAVTKNRVAMDGGGHKSLARCKRQMHYINEALKGIQ